MLDTWANDGLMVHARTQETIALTAGDATYTTLNLSTATRPAAVEDLGAFTRLAGVDEPLEMVSREQFARIAYKTAEGLPAVCWYEPAMANGLFEFYPTPYAAMTAYFFVRRVLTGTLLLGTTVSLPPGYEEAIVNNLAIRGAPSFGMTAPREVQEIARSARRALQVQNHVTPVMQSHVGPGPRPDILRGE
jgi:hypothetical protein